MGLRYECNLSPDTLKKAVQELNEPEDNRNRLEAIDSLRIRFLKDVKKVSAVKTDDAFLLRFLRFRKFNEDRAVKALKNYYRLREIWRDVFDLVDNPHLIQDFLDIGPVVPLKGRANDGTFVSIGCPGRQFGNDYGITQFVAATILTTEQLLLDEEAQLSIGGKNTIICSFNGDIYGITVIEDLEHFSIGLSFQMTIVARRFMNLMQDALPVRIKSLNVINEWRAFDIIYAVVRPFMNEKLRNRMQLHGTHLKTLHDIIDPEILPGFLLGNGPDQDIAWWKEEILNRTVVK